MKGIVLEKTNNKVIVLTKEGDMKKIVCYKDVEIGEEISTSNFISDTKIYTSIAAAFLLCIFSLAFYMMYYTPFGYVYVDINPSIKISYNRFDKVLDLDPLNDDGYNIVKSVNKKGAKVDDAIKAVIYEANRQKYLNQDKENYVLLTFATGQSEEEHLKIVEKEIENISSEINLDINWALLEADISEYKPDYKNSLGKQLLSKDDSDTKSVKELVENSTNENINRNLKLYTKKEHKNEQQQEKYLKQLNKEEKQIEKNIDKESKRGDKESKRGDKESKRGDKESKRGELDKSKGKNDNNPDKQNKPNKQVENKKLQKENNKGKGNKPSIEQIGKEQKNKNRQKIREYIDDYIKNNMKNKNKNDEQEKQLKDSKIKGNKEKNRDKRE